MRLLLFDVDTYIAYLSLSHLDSFNVHIFITKGGGGGGSAACYVVVVTHSSKATLKG